MRVIASAALAALVCLSSVAQRKLEPEQMYERIVCVVPMIGKGTIEDPRRPMFTPAGPDTTKGPQGVVANDGKEPEPGIIAFMAQESDDGKFAIVEFVAKDRKAFKEILDARSTHSELKVFGKSSQSKQQLLTELKRYKKDLNLDYFGVAAQ